MYVPTDQSFGENSPNLVTLPLSINQRRIFKKLSNVQATNVFIMERWADSNSDEDR
jgi:hypothetical protein